MDKHIFISICYIHGIFIYLCDGINEPRLHEINKLAFLL